MSVLRELFQSLSFILCLFFIFMAGFAVGVENMLAFIMFSLFAAVCLGLVLVSRRKEKL